MADKTPRDEMLLKWMGVGEILDDAELDFMLNHYVEPGFDDYGSRTILEAFRAGRTAPRE